MRMLTATLVAALAACSVTPQTPPSDPLPAWNDGPSKRAIVDFVARVTRTGGSDFVAPAERIATFDNDGTLWAEQPMYFQMLFALDRVKVPDAKTALAGGEKAVTGILAAAHAGITTDEFAAVARDWLASARHPTTKQPFTKMVYAPMVELLAYLRANGFKTFIVSGGGVEFMRAFAEETYGIPPEQVIGSTGRQRFEMRDGKPVLFKLPEVDFVDDGPGKPVSIQKFIGRRPIAAFGNSDGDLEMLQWTCSGAGARFCLYVHHTDAAREWAYDRASSIGKLDKGLDEARARGWTVVDMKADWRRVF